MSINVENLLVPPILFFGLGFIASLIKSDLKISDHFTNALSVYLIVAIGLQGGIAFRSAQLDLCLKSVLAAVMLGCIQTIASYFFLSRMKLLDPLNSAAIAAHYGSVSISTFLTAVGFLADQNIVIEGYPTIMLGVMEVPSIIIGIIIAQLIRIKKKVRNAQANTSNMSIMLQHVAKSGGILLLVGSIAIGIISRKTALNTIQPFFDHIFSGVLCLFLIAMGIESAKRLSESTNIGPALILFGIIAPLFGGTIGLLTGHYLLGFGVGGATLVAVLGASASYIAAPPVIRMAIPEASPTYYLTLALGITFPFNVTVGIPLYFKWAQILSAAAL